MCPSSEEDGRAERNADGETPLGSIAAIVWRYCSGMPKLHHVNLTIPLGGEDDEAKFLVDIMGYERIPAPEGLPMAKWFEFSDGTQIHLSEDPEHHPSARAHVAIELGPDLQATAERLDAAGYEVLRFDGSDVRVVFCQDPAGNRWELRDPIG